MQGDGWANMPGDGINEGAYGCSWSLRGGDDQMFFTVPEKRVHCQVEEMQPGMGHF
jgi:hypothetical protein